MIKDSLLPVLTNFSLRPNEIWSCDDNAPNCANYPLTEFSSNISSSAVLALSFKVKKLRLSLAAQHRATRFCWLRTKMISSWIHTDDFDYWQKLSHKAATAAAFEVKNTSGPRRRASCSFANVECWGRALLTGNTCSWTHFESLRESPHRRRSSSSRLSFSSTDFNLPSLSRINRNTQQLSARR